MSANADIDTVSHGVEQTRRLGERLSKLLRPGSIILLEGEFGTGKTSFTQGIAKGLGIDSRYVNSPTFTLINEYKGGRLPLYHIDLYRLGGVKDVATLGLDDYLDGTGVTVIEWPQGAAPWLPTDRLTVRFTHVSETKRTIRFYSSGAPYRSLMDEFKKEAYGT
ncbi:MAG TPA: tRNA (adenosine(37)-N6)-threonylcarbamoyltransferase complex ATPase subunit type 1 TsaE [Chloroflexia bacterium]|nr:tRNA (adenosine(37)-N6)-threonylcarbamoyltransferase complex ATPase subunit type 1 TsaE [Chloroflexia bacterium]